MRLLYSYELLLFISLSFADYFKYWGPRRTNGWQFERKLLQSQGGQLKYRNLLISASESIHFPVRMALLLAVMAACVSCNKTATAPEESAARLSSIKVDVQHGGPAILTTASAEFQVLPSGYVEAFLVKNGNKLTLDEPRLGSPTDSDYVVQGQNDVHFVLDFDQAKITEATGKLGRGKHLEIPAHALGPSGAGIQRTYWLTPTMIFPAFC
jgi:hypothetical protein